MATLAKYHTATLIDPPCPTAAYDALLDKLDNTRDEIRELSDTVDAWQDFQAYNFPPEIEATLKAIGPDIQRFFSRKQQELSDTLEILKDEEELFGMPWK